MKQGKLILLKRGSTLLLRGAIAILALIVLVLAVFAAPDISVDLGVIHPELANVTILILFILYSAAVTFWYALFQATKLLSYIDQNKAFSSESVEVLRQIKHCAAIIAGLFTAFLPVVYLIAEHEDAPGMIIIFGIVFIFAPFVVAVFASLLQKLFQNAIDIKNENDLTV